MNLILAKKMHANKLADDLDNANGFQYIAQLGLASQAATILRQQEAEIESLKLQLHTTLSNRNLEKPAVEDVMAEHCTCYKLGYSLLNDYALVKQK